MRIKQGIVGLAAASVLGLLAGCEGVGDGSAPDPDSGVITKSGGTAALGNSKLFTCVAQQLQYNIAFTGGTGTENFTNRAKWTAEPDGIVTVTNIGQKVVPEELDPDTHQPLVYTISGLVLPKAPGNVVIKANAFGIEKQIAMTVENPGSGSLRLKAVGYGDPLSTSIKMNHNSTQQLQLVGTLDGFETDLSASLKELVFETPDDTVATFLESNGVQTSIVLSNGKDSNPLNPTPVPLKDGALRVLPKLIACPAVGGVDNPIVAGVKMDVAVKAATGMVIQRELDSPVNGNVLALATTSGTTTLATTEILRTYATFDGNSDPAQNLSNQVYAVSSKPEVIVQLAFSQPTGITALSTGTGTTPPKLSEDVTLTYCQPEPPPKTLPTGYVTKCWPGKPTVASAVFKTRQSTLTDIAVTPVDGVIEALKTLQFRTVGSFDGGFKQDITRHVTWQAFANDGETRSTKVGIGSAGSLLAGLAISAFLENTDDDASNGTPLQDRTVKIKATNNAATVTKTQTVTATISQ
ncbi:hypothetical protein D0B54_10265 [Solimonas sp. K1W22B-7]|uniref:hypothetical protein n=1 Tax=Solimonas sp. K1W22B-7 TaxID=2303331 RepID=UPI000E32E295|nr:hypothetical protein [Solimonas sp. K1W22B-7]AXQ29048.1 hypothetical protein D0B54_10265 [Solimonas sp. K1W22B-7]